MGRVETIGDCTLYLGDCREVLPTLSGINICVTSPPYNQMHSVTGRKMTGIWGQKSGGAGFADAWQARGYADKVNEDEYQAEQNDLFGLISTVCAPDASLFYNHQLRWRDGDLLHPIKWFHPAAWSLRSEIIWNRAGGMMFNARMFCRFDERILWLTRDKWKWNQASVGHGTVWNIAREQIKDHPVAFPLEIPSRCIAAASDPGDTVLDPFAGSATTGVAAIQQGRAFVGIERDPRYFDIACRRIETAYRQPRLFAEPAPKPTQEAFNV